MYEPETQTCPACYGNKTYSHVKISRGFYDDEVPKGHSLLVWRKCPKCNGKGKIVVRTARQVARDEALKEQKQKAKADAEAKKQSAALATNISSKPDKQAGRKKEWSTKMALLGGIAGVITYYYLIKFENWREDANVLAVLSIAGFAVVGRFYKAIVAFGIIMLAVYIYNQAHK